MQDAGYRIQDDTGALVTGALVFLLFVNAILAPSAAWGKENV